MGEHRTGRTGRIASSPDAATAGGLGSRAGGAVPVRVTVFVQGGVQGVGFRWWTRSRALELGLEGFARNLADGRVEVCAQGRPEAVDRLVVLLGEQPSTRRRPGWVDSTTILWASPREDLTGFAEW
ncbi:MAG TPA: acylphosphatase [Candidatus Lustribacter sp.]|nr:acylphosphatase [Candidatus Lustribacter sp.]